MNPFPNFKNLVVCALACGILPCHAFDLTLQWQEGQPRLSWPSQGANKVYTLQHRTDLGRPDWVPLFPWDSWPIPGTSFADAIGPESARFYRLAVTERGRVVAVTFQETISPSSINLLIWGAEFQYGIDIPFTASYGVDVYRIDYETLDGLLGPTVASGALLVPTGMATAADLFSYQHGTLHRRADAPSSTSAQGRIIWD
jgi:hypothetical protein